MRNLHGEAFGEPYGATPDVAIVQQGRPIRMRKQTFFYEIVLTREH